MGRKPTYPFARIISLPKHLQKKSNRSDGNDGECEQHEQQRSQMSQHHQQSFKEECRDPSRRSHVMDIDDWRGRQSHPEEDDEALLSVVPTMAPQGGLSRFFAGSSSNSLYEDESTHSIDEGKHRKRKSVRFGSCEVRAYEQVLGDHPCCSMGCPLALGWDYKSCPPTSVDDYEASSKSSQIGENLRLTPEERREILKSVTSDVEVRRACRQLNRERLATTTRRGRKASQNFFSSPPPAASADGDILFSSP